MVFNLRIDIKNLGKKLRLQQVGLNDLDKARETFPNQKIENVQLIRDKFILRTDKEEFITASLSIDNQNKNVGVLAFSFDEVMARKFPSLFADETDVGVNFTGNFDLLVGERKYITPTAEEIKNRKDLETTVFVYNVLDQDKLRKAVTKVDRV